MTDPNGAVIPGAEISLTKDKTDIVRSAMTNDEGIYRIDGLAPGRYSVKATSRGFAAQTVKTIDVSANKPIIVNATMSIGAFSGVTLSEPDANFGKNVSSVAFSPDGRSILTGHGGKLVIQWNAQTGQESRRLRQDNSVHSVAVSPDGKYFLIAPEGPQARLIDAASGQTIREFDGGENIEFQSAVFSPDGREVLTGSYIGISKDGGAMLWDVNTGKLIRKFQDKEDYELRSAIFSPDGRFIVTLADDTARLWDAANGTQIRKFIDASDEPPDCNAVAISPDGRYILIGDNDNNAVLWDVSSGKMLRKFVGHTENVNSVAFSPDGRYVLTGGGSDDSDMDEGEKPDFTARLWDVNTGKEIRKFIGHTEMIVSVAFSRDGRMILTGSADRTARLWSVATGKEIKRFGKAKDTK